MRKRAVLIPLRLMFGLLALTALGRQFSIQVQHGLSLLNFFSYFTNLSNLFAALVLILGAHQLALHRDASVARDLLRGGR